MTGLPAGASIGTPLLALRQHLGTTLGVRLPRTGTWVHQRERVRPRTPAWEPFMLNTTAADAALRHPRARLSEAELATYKRDGLVVPDYHLPPAQLVEQQAALEQVIRDNPGVRGEKLISVHVVDNRAENIRGNQAFLDLAHDAAILDLVEQVLGPDIILWGCHLFCKPPGDGKEVPWHQDGHYWPIRPLANCTVWVALDYSGEKNGALRFIPGTHSGQAYSHHTDKGDHLALNQVLDPGQMDESTARTVTLQPGQMSLHDIHLVHGSNPNTSTLRRAGLALRYMPAPSLFDRGIGSMDPKLANFAERPLWLVRGEDRAGNDFRVGHAD